MRIYVACLASYNAGTLHGSWIDCEGKGADEIYEEIAAMLAASSEEGAEEFAIHDTEGFGDLVGEYTSIKEIAQLTEILCEVEDCEAFIEWADYIGLAYATIEGFRDAYRGKWESKKAYAECLADDLGFFLGVPDTVARYFDYEAFARDLFTSDYYMTNGGYVFNQNV
jgi:antirestriction protein